MTTATLSITRKRLAGVSEGAEYLGISIWTLRTWCYRGRCTSVKMGDRLMIEYAELDRMIAEASRPRLQKAC